MTEKVFVSENLEEKHAQACNLDQYVALHAARFMFKNTDIMGNPTRTEHMHALKQIPSEKGMLKSKNMTSYMYLQASINRAANTSQIQ